MVFQDVNNGIQILERTPFEKMVFSILFSKLKFLKFYKILKVFEVLDITIKNKD